MALECNELAKYEVLAITALYISLVERLLILLPGSILLLRFAVDNEVVSMSACKIFSNISNLETFPLVVVALRKSR